MVSVPTTSSPGASVPTLLIVVADTIPLPESFALEFTDTPPGDAIKPSTCNVPAETVVAPAYVPTPESVSVPAPVLVSPPMPESVPPSVALLPLVSKLPPPDFSVTARFEAKPARYCKVPPPKTRSPVPAPRLLSAATASVPALIVVPPK